MLPGVDRTVGRPYGMGVVMQGSAITNFIDLVERNPDTSVDLRFFTTSDIGTEQAIADHPHAVDLEDNMAGLHYWKRLGAGANILPLRKVLESNKFPDNGFARVVALSIVAFNIHRIGLLLRRKTRRRRAA